MYEQCTVRVTCLKTPNTATVERGRTVIDKLAEQEIFEESQQQLATQISHGYKLKGMSHPRMDFRAFN